MPFRTETTDNFFSDPVFKTKKQASTTIPNVKTIINRTQLPSVVNQLKPIIIEFLKC